MKTSARVLIALLLVILHYLLFIKYPGETLEYSLLDRWFATRGALQAPDDVVVIAMDELSYRDLGIPANRPWPRALHAKLLSKLKQYGAKRVVFDVLFVDAGADPEADMDLAQALSLLPTYLGAERTLKESRTLSSSYYITELVEPFPPFKESAAGLALVGLPEVGGVIRHFLDTKGAENFIPSLAEAAAGTGNKGPDELDLINYYGPAGAIPTLSYYQVLQEEVPLPRSALEGKIVFVGLVLRTEVGPAQKDAFVSPYLGERIFGTEIHATAALNLIHRSWISRSSKILELSALSLVCVLATILITALNPLRGGIATLLGIVSWGLIAYIGFINNRFIPGANFALIILPLLYLGSTLYYYYVTRQAQIRVQRAFEYYLPPEMAREVAKNKTTLKLGGEKIVATAMFTDISGFTSIAESLPPEKVSEMLNAYFTEVMEAVFRNNGTVIKFIGDAVFAVWGAPIKIDNHAELALKTGREILRDVARFNATGKHPPLNTRVGIHTGPMVIGNLGSARRFDYTAVGDSVNLAARLEGLNKYFGTGLLYSEATKNGATEGGLWLGRVAVAGKDEAIDLYTSSEGVDEQERAQWEQAVQHFVAREFVKSRELFKTLAISPSKLRTASAFYLTQVANLEQNPPGSAWNGALSFLTK